MTSINTHIVVAALLISTQSAMAIPSVTLTKLRPTVAVDLKAMHEHKYKDVLKDVINNTIEKIMHAETFPIYVPLGSTVELCGNDETAIPINQADVLVMIQNLHDIGYTATVHDNPNTPIDTLVISKDEDNAPLPGIAK